MNAIDTSVAVAALLEWHEFHTSCARAARDALIPAHALVETYSVLTRLPPAHRPDRSRVAALLAGRFPTERVLVPSATLQTGIVRRLHEAGIEGGACYDALVALTASDHGIRLASCDVRAVRTYDALGIDHVFVGPDR